MYLSENLKKELIKRITKITTPQKVILFGSYANGTATENSDIDILIVEKEIKSKLEEKRKIRKALYDIDISKDIIVVSEEEFDFYKNDFGSIVKEAVDKGLELWNI
ncbi:MAG: uncharacterized protein PWP46_1798 [Fusobacteriaceae bacterium]|jgi:predicted nucleotidyltransferase|nr:nucleotidyltransferase protein [Fusobacteriales bacterium]MDN5304912.1 uncharacterized protein [Fusobacteriaceae bacterium]